MRSSDPSRATAAAPAGTRALAWLVTGAPGRGVSFALDLAAAARRGLRQRYR